MLGSMLHLCKVPLTGPFSTWNNTQNSVNFLFNERARPLCICLFSSTGNSRYCPCFPCLQTNKHPLALRSPIQKELVKFFLCEFRLIFRHNCVEEGLSFFRDPLGPAFRSFSDAQPGSFFIIFFFTTDPGRVSKN